MKTKLISLVSILALFLMFLGVTYAQDNNDNRGRDRDARAAVGSTIEVHVNNNGKVLVRGAKVTSVAGSTINAAVSFGSFIMNWAVLVQSNTKFVEKRGGAANINEVKVGDFISFSGLIDASATTPTVKADLIKNWSLNKALLQKRNFEGILKSISGTTAPVTMVLTIGNQDFTVNVPAGISILSNNWSSTSLANFQVGNRIRVYGAVRSDSATTIDATVIRNISL